MKFIASLALATAMSAPAFAGGMTAPVPEPVITPIVVAPVTRDWSGFYAGAQLGYGDLSSNVAGLNGDGAIGGLHAGYRADFGQFVLGGELAYNGSNIDLGPTSKLNSLTQLKLMGGYDLGNALVYATVGGAHASANLGGVKHSDNGYLIGLGMDYAINDSWTIGGEITHNRFNNFDKTGSDIRANVAQIRVGYRF
ncbi:outer membrane protein [Pseudorhodobacter sp.]|uniref:outer membrane protein n=1 Tax=Pseudorhodobacter sp. TaxID=1934400 RepID=UPI002649B58D|nr:outer membrane beta-barrel protein [Pseudorhodobacter sp.]MDN5786087.1 porin family protein [Pseudorhodobacter sp.]